jgi:Tetratricopeptide repeat
VLRNPREERKVQAVLKMHMAHNRIDLGQFEQASDDFRHARVEVARDPRLCALCEAIPVRVSAIQGLRAEAIAGAEALLRAIESPAVGVPNRWVCQSFLGRSFLDAGEVERAVGCFERVRAETRYPISQPLAWYYLGECARRLGDLPRAREDFKQATSLGIDSHHSRLAEQRLGELLSQPELMAANDHSSFDDG